jgi:iron complex transport system substrate-binding protein
MRIVSLLPSATEIVYALGLGDALFGVSHECDFPPEAKNKPKIIEPTIDTGQISSQEIDSIVSEHLKRGERLYRIKMNELEEANPDIIITQELCDVCAIGAEDVLAAANELGKPVDVLSLNPHSLDDVRENIRSVGKATGVSQRADDIVAELDRKTDKVKRITANATRPRVLCVEWLKPLMNAGHWILEMAQHAGGTEGLASMGKPSTYIDWNSVLRYDPQVIVLMLCGFTIPRTEAAAKDLLDLRGAGRISAVRDDRVYATDGHSYFSRSGPRLFDGIRILAQIIHPELFNELLNVDLAKCVSV